MTSQYLQKLSKIESKLIRAKKEDKPYDTLFNKVYSLSDNHVKDLFGIDLSDTIGFLKLNDLLSHSGEFIFIGDRFVDKHHKDRFKQSFDRSKLEEIVDACLKMESKLSIRNMDNYLEICACWGKRW